MRRWNCLLTRCTIFSCMRGCTRVIICCICTSSKRFMFCWQDFLPIHCIYSHLYTYSCCECAEMCINVMIEMHPQSHGMGFVLFLMFFVYLRDCSKYVRLYASVLYMQGTVWCTYGKRKCTHLRWKIHWLRLETTDRVPRFCGGILSYCIASPQWHPLRTSVQFPKST